MDKPKKYGIAVSDLPEGALGMPESILEESVFTDEDIEALMKALYEKAVPQTNRYFIDPVTGAVIVVP